MSDLNEHLARALFNMVMDGFIVYDASGRVVLTNEAARRMFGWADGDLTGTAVETLLPGAVQPNAPAGDGSAPATSRAIEGRRRDGSVFQVSVSTTHVGEGADTVYGLVMRDATDGRRLEAELKLREEKLSAVATVVEGITNDFNNTLGVILANLSLAMEDVGPEHAASRKLEQIRAATGKAANFVQRILGEIALLPGRESKVSWAGRLARTRTLHRASVPSRVVPPAAPATTGSAAAAPVSPAELTRLHVLLVDDEEPLLLAATKILERQGYRVTPVTRVAEALEVVRREPHDVDLVVADYIMPGASGLDLAAEVRMLRYDLPIMIVSGRLTEEVRMEAAAVGVAELLPKPYTSNALLEVVRRLLPASRALAS